MMRLMLTLTDIEFKNLDHYATSRGQTVNDAVHELLQNHIFGIYPLYRSLYNDEKWSQSFRDNFIDWSRTMIPILQNEVFEYIDNNEEEHKWIKDALRIIASDYLTSMEVLAPLFDANGRALREEVTREREEKSKKDE